MYRAYYDGQLVAILPVVPVLSITFINPLMRFLKHVTIHVYLTLQVHIRLRLIPLDNCQLR